MDTDVAVKPVEYYFKDVVLSVLFAAAPLALAAFLVSLGDPLFGAPVFGWVWAIILVFSPLPIALPAVVFESKDYQLPVPLRVVMVVGWVSALLFSLGYLFNLPQVW